MLVPCPSNPTRVCQCVCALSSFDVMACCLGFIGTQSLQPFHRNTILYRHARKRCQRLNTYFSILFPSFLFEIPNIDWWTELVRLIFLFCCIDDLWYIFEDRISMWWYFNLFRYSLTSAMIMKSIWWISVRKLKYSVLIPLCYFFGQVLSAT